MEKIKNIFDLRGVNIRHSFLLNKEITSNQALILSLFCDMDISDSIPNNSDLAKFFAIEKTAVSRLISGLIANGFLEVTKRYTDKEAYDYLCKINSEVGCRFCGFNRTSLDEHHYPIRAKDGGIDTITLCANCHREFHEITDHNRKLRLTQKTKDLL